MFDFITVSMDELNKPTEKIKMVKKLSEGSLPMRSIYVTVLTNGYTKILRIQDMPPVRSLDEETKLEVDPSKTTSLELQVAMVNFSIVEAGKELLTLYLEGISAKIENSPGVVKFSMVLASLQIDN